MKQLTIGEVACYAGIQASAIRYYEREGLLPPPDRVNGHRRYDLSVLKRLGLIQLARQVGFGIREIQVLFNNTDDNPSPVDHWQTLAVNKIDELDALIKQTQIIKAWLSQALKSECTGVDDCVAITCDENEDGVRVILTCEMAGEDSPTEINQLLELMTMQ